MKTENIITILAKALQLYPFFERRHEINPKWDIFTIADGGRRKVILQLLKNSCRKE